MENYKTIDISKFSIDDVNVCEKTIQKLSEDAPVLEYAAQDIVKYFYENLTTQIGPTLACSLVRCFITYPFHDLSDNLKSFLTTKFSNTFEKENNNCLILLATSGEREDWNCIEKSINHQAIPLTSREMIAQFPMISQLLEQCNIDIGKLLKPGSEVIVDISTKSYNVFFVPLAEGNAYIPAQAEFVIPYKIKSVIGFGSMLNSGLFATIILFLKHQVDHKTANLFKIIALALDMAFSRFDKDSVFRKDCSGNKQKP